MIDLLRDLGYSEEEAASARLAALLAELAEAEAEIVAVVEATAHPLPEWIGAVWRGDYSDVYAWTPDVHDTSEDTLTVEAAADHLKDMGV